MGAAAIILRRQRQLVEAFRNAGATSAGRACTPEELGQRSRLPFRRLAMHGVFVRVHGAGSDGDRWYLDELAWRRFRERQRRLGLAILLVIVVAGGVAVVAGGLGSR